MGNRHASRCAALQALYALDLNPEIDRRGALQRALEDGGDELQGVEFAEGLVQGVQQHQRQVEQEIRVASHRWKPERMDRVDVCVLRLAVYELLHRPDTPAQVILNEGVELAKEFGTPESPGFVNGILDRIAHQHRKEDLAAD